VPSFDPEAAKALLADYGQPVKFTFKLLKGSQEIEDSQRAIVEYWNDLGADVSLEIVADLTTYVTAAITGNYQAIGVVAGSLGDPDSVLYEYFHTGGSYNFMKYSSPVVDEALDDGRHTDDAATRQAAYATVQQELRKDQPGLIESHGQIYIVATNDLAM